jgi:HemY protein
MRWAGWLLLILASASGLALLLRFNHGNVAILWPPYRIDFSVNLAVLVLLLGFLALHLLLIALGRVLDLPRKVREYRSRRQLENAQLALRDALLALFEGRFGRAERLAEVARDDARFAGPAALLAARAAHRMLAFERRDRWLAQAREDRSCENAELMSTAELALEQRDTQRALEAIDRLHGKGLRHIHSLRTALRAHEHAGDWPRVLAVLRQLEKRDALPEPAIRGLRVRACRALFAARSGDASGLRELWNGLKPQERALPEAVESAALAFAVAGDEAQAARLIESALELEPSSVLLRAYAGLSAVPARERIQRVEQWRARHGDDPDFFLALGRLCVSERIWGKAEEYLGRCIAARPTRGAHLAMAELGEAIGRPELAARHYRAAARIGLEGTEGTEIRAVSLNG